MKPKNPSKIILRNKFYPSGLKEIDIWNYYQINKKKILDNTRGRNVMLFLRLDGNLIVRNKAGKTIKLNARNYDEILTGRTISIHSIIRNIEDFGIVDVDCKNFRLAKEATKKCWDLLLSSGFFIDQKIRFTGKTSFHIVCKLSKRSPVNRTRELLAKILQQSGYPINKTRKNTVNLDLFRNVKNAGFITEGSLSVIGLKCMEVDVKELDFFTPSKAMI